MKDFYTELYLKKKSWIPTCGSSDPVMPGSEQTIGRCLALRTLEIPVGEWIEEAKERELRRLPDSAIALLQSNIIDEHRHDEALNLAATANPLTNSSDDDEGHRIATEWINHPDHPIVKAGVIESSIFFVILPIFRMLGNPGLRVVSQDISTDEAIHVATNRYVAAQLGYTFSPSLNRLREETVNWLVETLDAPGKFGNKNLWIESSRSLLERGIAPNLTETKAFVMPAFFEHRNDNLPIYGNSNSY